MNIDDAYNRFLATGRLKHVTIVKSDTCSDRRFHHESDTFEIFVYPHGDDDIIDVPPGTVFVRHSERDFVIGEP